jgi:hypothetical protein
LKIFLLTCIVADTTVDIKACLIETVEDTSSNLKDRNSDEETNNMYEDDGSKKQEKLNYNEDGDDEQESERNHAYSKTQRL